MEQFPPLIDNLKQFEPLIRAPWTIDWSMTLFGKPLSHKYPQCSIIEHRPSKNSIGKHLQDISEPTNLTVGDQYWLIKHLCTSVDPTIVHRPLLGWHGNYADVAWNMDVDGAWHIYSNMTLSLTWDGTWTMTCYDTSSTSFLDQPLVISLGWNEHLTESVYAWSSNISGRCFPLLD